MKKEGKVIYLSELFLLVYIIIFKNFISENLIKYAEVLNITFLIVLLFGTCVFLGFPKRELLINKNGKQTLLICFIWYYVLTYLFGLFFGFLKSAYLLRLFNVSKNVLYAISFYALKEMYRYTIVQKIKEKNCFSIILLVILLAGLDIVMEINAYSFSNGTLIFEFIESSILPRLALSLLLTYIAYRFNYKLSVFYLVLFELPKYFLPIFPDMGMYIESIVKLIFMFLCYYHLSILFEKYERKIPTVNNGGLARFKVTLMALMIFVFIGLVSGTFKYHLFAIGSNSMTPVFSRGDVVLIEKLDINEIEKIEENDIVAFNYNNQIIVHRVVSIEKNGEIYNFKTKGDNNNSVDAWTLDSNDIYGRVEGIVKYLGIPSVELSELMNKEW